MAKSKQSDKAPAKGEEYEFKLPDFDEKAFIRREMLSARASFYTLGFGFGAGLVSVVLFAIGLPWNLGWLPIFASMAILRPLLTRLGFPEDVTKWKAMAGNMFMIFFTGLAVWILGVNVV